MFRGLMRYLTPCGLYRRFVNFSNIGYNFSYSHLSPISVHVFPFSHSILSPLTFPSFPSHIPFFPLSHSILSPLTFHSFPSHIHTLVSSPVFFLFTFQFPLLIFIPLPSASQRFPLFTFPFSLSLPHFSQINMRSRSEFEFALKQGL